VRVAKPKEGVRQIRVNDVPLEDTARLLDYAPGGYIVRQSDCYELAVKSKLIERDSNHLSRYLGSKTAPPILRHEGIPDLYFIVPADAQVPNGAAPDERTALGFSKQPQAVAVSIPMREILFEILPRLVVGPQTAKRLHYPRIAVHGAQ
jgi:hypothetical protein